MRENFSAAVDAIANKSRRGELSARLKDKSRKGKLPMRLRNETARFIMAKKSFFKGAVILGAAGVIVKLLGAFFRIPLANIIGDTGMGYYQTAYPVYVLLLTISTAGIPTAIARLVSEKTALGDHREASRIFKLSFGLMLAIGIITSALLYFGAPAIVGLMKGKEEAIASMKAIAPALLFVPVMASFRGYFQGRQEMTPTGISQVIEQLFRVAAGLGLAVYLLPTGLKYAAAGASSGATIGEFCGLFCIILIYIARRSKIRRDIETQITESGAQIADAETQITESGAQIADIETQITDVEAHDIRESLSEKTSKSKSKNPANDDVTLTDGKRETGASIIWKIIAIAIPITIGAAIMAIMSAIDLALVARRLIAAGYTSAEANSLYGQISGFAAPLINIPQVITQAISISLVPAVASAYSLKDRKFLQYNVTFGIRTSMLIGLPCAVGLIVLARPIMLLLYYTQKESALNAAGSLAILAFGAAFLALVQTLTGILQGIGKQMIPVKNLLIGAVVKIIITYVLTGIYSVNIKGAAIGTVAAYITAAALDLIAVRKHLGIKLDVRLTFAKPALCALIMGLVAAITYRCVMHFCGNTISTLAAVLLGVAVYAVLILAFKAITPDEIEKLPKGKKIIKLLKLKK